MRYIKFITKLLCLASLFCFSSISNASSVEVLDNSLDFTYENLSLPKNEVMGLVGANYLINLNSGLNYGLGVYGATRGKRGGFFTGGGQLQYQVRASKLLGFGLEGFVGGGGGGGAPQGGGLMIRGGAYFALPVNTHLLKLGYSKVSFPNGEIESDQFYLGYNYSFKTLHIASWSVEPIKFSSQFGEKYAMAIVPQNFSFQTSFYFPQDNTKGVSGKEMTNRLDVIGIRYQSHLVNSWWFDFETGGALGGGIDGFAQVFGGLSYKLPISRRLGLSAGSQLGAAGGGDVYTGGGTVAKFYTGLEFKLLNSWHLFAHLGYLTAPGGKFEATTFNVNVAKYYEGLSFSNSGVSYKNRKIYNRKFRIRSGIQSYSYYLRHSRKSPQVRNHPVTSVQLKLDSFMNESFYFSGHAIGAMDGKAGGYAVGLVGAGYQITNVFNAEFLFGAAGGGGIDVGHGVILEPGINYEIPLSEQWSLEAGLGFIQAIDGKLSSWVTSFGTSYRFGVPGVR